MERCFLIGAGASKACCDEITLMNDFFEYMGGKTRNELRNSP